MVLDSDLILNFTYLAVLVLVSGIIDKKWHGDTIAGLCLQSLAFGLVSVFCILTPFNLAPGILVDCRTITLALCAIFFGPWAAAVAGGMAGIVRVGVGGEMVIPGLLLILLSLLIGNYFHKGFKSRISIKTITQLSLAGLLIHLNSLLLVYFLLGEEI